MEKVYTQMWIELDKDIREHLMNKLNIKRTGTSEVRDQTLISDGVTNDDLSGITKVKMCEYTGSPMETDFAQLWMVTKSKAKYEIHPPMDVPLIMGEVLPQITEKEVVELLEQSIKEVKQEVENGEGNKESGKKNK